MYLQQTVTVSVCVCRECGISGAESWALKGGELCKFACSSGKKSYHCKTPCSKSKLHRMLVRTVPLHAVPSLPPSANPALLQFQLKRLNWRKLRYGGVRCDDCAGGVALVEKQCHALGWGTLKSLSVSFSFRFLDLNWNGVGKGSWWSNSCAFRVDLCCFALMSK